MVKTSFEKPKLAILCHWIRERESIRLKREAGKPAPWTKDPFLANYRFCNVRRMDDKVSRWLQSHWYPYAESVDVAQTLAHAALARLINWPETLVAIDNARYSVGPQFVKKDFRAIEHCLMDRVRRGEKVFTGAYIINGAAGGPKYKQVLNIVKAVCDCRELDGDSSLHQLFDTLCTIKGLGSFMAGQIIADCMAVYNSPRWHGLFGEIFFAPIGPGSRRGMNRLIDRYIHEPLHQPEFSELLGQLIRVLQHRLPQSITERLCAMDYQNCLCEFDKYMRLTQGGRVRARYTPGA